MGMRTIWESCSPNAVDHCKNVSAQLFIYPFLTPDKDWKVLVARSNSFAWSRQEI